MSIFVDTTANDIHFVSKRGGEKESFELEKIQNSILKAMEAIDRVDEEVAEKVARTAERSLFKYEHITTVTVDEIGDVVENKLMDVGLNNVAKEYILYRSKNKPNIFKKRVNLKPYEYPELMEYVDAIRHSYWLHTEFNYSSDIQDLKVNLSSEEAAIVKKAMLAIAQIEVNVKTFWSKIYDWFPKPEFQAIAVTFGESEVRHTDAYSNLLELAGLNHEFEELMDEPAIATRIEYF